MKISTGVQVARTFFLNNLRGCNVGITDLRDFFKYAVEMGSGAMMNVPSFIKIGSGIQKLLGGGGGYTYRHTDAEIARRSYKPTFTFSKQGE
jgi:hypothetical protein